jgi:tagatose 1,6-diphosphate aldolase GatY/KbaY
MAIATAQEILLEAARGKYAVGAFNITNIIQMETVVETAVELNAPLIIQTSVSPSKSLGRDVLVAVYRVLAESAPIPIALHLDHCEDVDYCKKCALAGYTNIMIDASKQTFEENIRQTKEVVDFCHALSGVSVEGELGTVSGVEDQVKVAEDEAQLCNPQQALEFVERTGLDLLAPAIGTAHGVYKTANPKIDVNRLKMINALVNPRGAEVPLVVHGGTGLPEPTVKALIEAGGSKFNVSTDLKHAWIDGAANYLAQHREDYNPGKMDKALKAATRDKIVYWINLLESAGKAG